MESLKKLQNTCFHPGELKPTGWLRRQLRIQADGLCGNLDRVWKDIRDSKWIGGNCEGWERVPYWLDGFIPMAYLLEDDDLIARAKRYIDAILAQQQEDGWICPCTAEERANYDTWATLLILKVLALYGDCSGDERATVAVERCLRQFDRFLNVNTLLRWGAARWFEGLVSIFWLYEKKPEPWLLNLAVKLKIQGFDWNTVFQSGFIDTCRTGWDFQSHVVNIAMMLKCDALFSRVFDIDPEQFANFALDYLERNHSMATGHFTGDENLSGDSPIHGTELCGVVETMYSYEWLFAVSGNPKWLDRLEKLAYNALPAAVSADMWTHQYDQMTNQVASFPMEKQPFRTNNKYAHLFGLEPNFGCCTANFGQGFPKFAMNTFLRTEAGIASCALAPASVETEINGVKVNCECITEYPFRDTLTYRITTAQPVAFPFSIRIPACAVKAEADGVSIPVGAFHTVNREWNGTCEIHISLHFNTALVSRPRNMVCVWRGPLLYAIPVREIRERIEYTEKGVVRKYPYCDYHLYPDSKWNYALTSDRFEVRNIAFEAAFDSSLPPLELTATVCEIPWGFHDGHCDEQPECRKPVSEPVSIQMIPYGCTDLRMTEIPFLGTECS